jgi:hypothetical protein
MNRIRSIHAAMATLAGALLALVGAPAAFASKPPGYGRPATTPTTVHVIATGGMPGWQITLIAVGAALVAAIVAVLLDRVRMARKVHASTA